MAATVKYLFLESSESQNDRRRIEREDQVYRFLNIDSKFGGKGISRYIFSSKKQKSSSEDSEKAEMKKLGEDILFRTKYKLVEMPFESTSWLTVMVAQLYGKIRYELEKTGNVVRLISEALNSEKKPSFVDEVKITQLTLGTNFPRILAAKVTPGGSTFGMKTVFKIEFTDALTIGFDTRLKLNWPKADVAVLPVSMVLTATKFTGTLSVDIISDKQNCVEISVLPNYRLDMDVQTLVGEQAKLQNLPMLTSLIIRKIRAAFANAIVYPNSKRVGIQLPFTNANPSEPNVEKSAGGGNYKFTNSIGNFVNRFAKLEVKKFEPEPNDQNTDYNIDSGSDIESENHIERDILSSQYIQGNQKELGTKKSIDRIAKSDVEGHHSRNVYEQQGINSMRDLNLFVNTYSPKKQRYDHSGPLDSTNPLSAYSAQHSQHSSQIFGNLRGNPGTGASLYEELARTRLRNPVHHSHQVTNTHEDSKVLSYIANKDKEFFLTRSQSNGVTAKGLAAETPTYDTRHLLWDYDDYADRGIYHSSSKRNST
ncbi:Maintenance of mitochondrial morphology protein 1 [Zancudomyces culisetae]|uniref:Maintenance of mitochondrial morphology protein 1 n=1 Tax=Zancudomyces culisetae TaxID=1213189 RepID=A0A1R1PXN7_ZANCU|nr:Maintenance of mitochondrial morphology protein 1 [Zancudomyces culisetae]|eukprot:OMH85755.1 Maintenance of mitochondrial morphology protein 1 [Zancudomyces culisetae]